MAHTRPSIAPGVMIESIAEDLLVMVPGREQVLRLSGEAAELVRTVQAGGQVDLSSDSAVELVELGVVVGAAALSRRGLLRAGALGTGMGMAALAMPSVAAAASSDGVLVGSYNLTNSFVTLSVFKSPNPTFPFNEGDTLPLLTDVKVVGGSATEFDGTVSSISVFSFPPSPPFAVWHASNTGNFATVFDGTNVVQGQFVFNSETFTVRFSFQPLPS